MNTTKIASLVIIIAAFAIGETVNSYLPPLDDIMTRNFTVAGDLNKPVSLRSGEVTVDNVEVTQEVDYKGTLLTTPEAFVVADLTLEPSGDSAGISNVTVTGGDGKVYGGAQQNVVTPQCVGSQPGIPLTCRVFIEVGKDSLPGASLQFYNFNSMKGDQVATVDLGLDGTINPTTSLGLPPQVGTRIFGDHS